MRDANLPNLLSFFRILLVPVLVTILLTEFEGKEFAGLAVFLLAIITDFFDGFFARKWGIITQLGKVLDPAADKILISSAFISLVAIGIAPAWMVVIIVAREFAVSTLRTVASSKGIIIQSGLEGKIKTVLQTLAICLLIVKKQLGSIAIVAELSLWLALFATVVSGIVYFWKYRNILFAY